MPASLAAWAGTAVLLGAVLVAAGQPIFTDDTWWHLVLGEAYLASGPWLDADPLLHTAVVPLRPTAWLFDAALAALADAAGLQALRVLHALLVAGIFGLVASLLRRATGSWPLAALGTALFGVLGAYRLIQLRPELVSVLAVLLLVRLLIEPRPAPSWRRVSVAVLLMALWANLHAAFLLGPILLAAAAVGLLVELVFLPGAEGAVRVRLLRVSAAAVLGALATLANPEFAAPHLAWFEAGVASPELRVVSDEWARFPLFSAPLERLPPSPLAWGLVWCLLVCTAAVAASRLREGRVGAELALAGAGLAAMLLAVRFTWLGVLALLWIGAWLAERAPGRRRVVEALAALGCLLLAPGFFAQGAWPMISNGIALESYGRAYPPNKYYAQPIWWLADVGVEGRAFNEYFQGGFLGYWLGPVVKPGMAGTLNVPPWVMDAQHAVLARRGLEPGESFEALLERLGVDVFVGIGAPMLPPSTRAYPASTRLLERSPDWVPVFRNALSAVYVPRGPRGAANRERIAAWYARQGLPFDPERGFDTEGILRKAPRWARRQGLVPVDYWGLLERIEKAPSEAPEAAQLRVASVLATLGSCERAIALYARVVARDPGVLGAQRRMVWCLVQTGRLEEAVAAVEAWPDEHHRDGLALLIAQAARDALAAGDGPEGEARRAAIAATLPAFAQEELVGLIAGLQQPEVRPASARRAVSAR